MDKNIEQLKTEIQQSDTAMRMYWNAFFSVLSRSVACELHPQKSKGEMEGFFKEHVNAGMNANRDCNETHISKKGKPVISHIEGDNNGQPIDEVTIYDMEAVEYLMKYVSGRVDIAPFSVKLG